MNPLNKETREKIDRTFCEAKKALEDGDKTLAEKLVKQAWESLPEPKFEWDVSKSNAHAAAELYRDMGNFSAALRIMDELFSSETVKPYQDQPYFVKGTIYYEMGDFENAKIWLKKAAKISKERCFEDEPEKYYKLIH